MLSTLAQKIQHLKAIRRHLWTTLGIENHLKLLISQSKFSGPRKFTLRYQFFEIARVEK